MNSKTEGLLALSPVALLLILFLMSLIAGTTQVVPVFLAVAIYSIAISKGSVKERITTFSTGASDKNILYMIWIFILAGAFGAVAKHIGAVDSTVAATLWLIPPKYLPAGIFIAACFISIAIGTSVGTIVVMCPIAAGFADQLSAPVGWFVAIIIGGAFFGDNLSFISDTTIAATQTQGCSMKDKFKANFLLVLPAAVISTVLYLYVNGGIEQDIALPDFQFVKIVPYILVMVLMFCGIDVLVMLVAVLIVASAIGFCCEDFCIEEFCKNVTEGVGGMFELITVTMLAGGILGVIKERKGLELVIDSVGKRIKSRAGAESTIAAITAVTNLCTANNTIAILTTGDMAREIAKKYSIPPKRTASIMDTVSCFIQGIIPYGAQMLIATQMVQVSASEVIPHLYYPFLIGAMVVISILTRFFIKK